MNARKSKGLLVWQFMLVCLLMALAFQSFGMQSLAAPAAFVPEFQNGTPTPVQLACGSSPATPTYCNIEIVLMIDDSGSMRTNDPGGWRNRGAINLVNILADQYYSAAQSLKEDNPNFQLPDVRVAVIHFSNGVKKNSSWVLLDPNDVEQWKSDLYAEINWPPRGTKEYTDFYARKQYTSFSEAFALARRLLQSNSSQADDGGCTRRSILLFTDGTPENARGILSGDALDQEMADVLSATSSMQDALSEDSKVRIYITGFKIDNKYWSQVEDDWLDIAQYAQPAPEEDTLERVLLLGDTGGSLEGLPARMEAITASLIDVRRFAVNQTGTRAYPVVIPAHVESIRFTLYNSDTAASLEITDPDGNLITVDSPGVAEVSGQGSPIQVWQLTRPAAGRYSVRAQNATRPGIITWLLAYQGFSITFDNPPGSFEPGQEGNLSFTLTDSADQPVLADQDNLEVKVAITQFGEQETFQEPALVDGKYNLSWTPRNSRPAQFTVTLTEPGVGLGLNCSLVFDLISIQTITVTPSITDTPTSTPTSTPTKVPPVGVTPVPAVAIFPQCVPSGENVKLPMRVVYGDGGAFPASFAWQVSSANPGVAVKVNSIDATSGEFELNVGPVSRDAGPIRLKVAAQDTRGGQTATLFELESPPLSVCAVTPECDCNSGPWALWFWPLVVALLVLLIVLLVLRFRDGQPETAQHKLNRDIFQSRDWHLLFWPLLGLFVLLLLVRPLGWCCLLPPWTFLVSLLLWLTLTLVLRLVPDDPDGPQPRPGWLLLLLLVLMFFGFLVIWFPVLLTLWLLLVLLTVVLTLWWVSLIIFVPVTSLAYSLSPATSCIPFNEALRLPLRLHGLEGRLPDSAPEWEVSAQLLPEGSVMGRVESVDAGQGEYALLLDPIPYNAETSQVQVQIFAAHDGRSLPVLGLPITLDLCPPDDLADLEGIGPQVQDLLYRHGILTYKQLSRTDLSTLKELLDQSDWKMMDAKTWPQQAKLAAIAQELPTPENRQNYVAYKNWLKDGIEPDEYDRDEKDRRGLALPWNPIPEFTPLVLSLALDPSGAAKRDPIVLPLQLNREADEVRLEEVDWEVSALAMPAGEPLEAQVRPAAGTPGTYELLITPSQDQAAREIQVSVQALVHGRSMEIYNGKALTVQVNPLAGADDLADLEGIGPATVRILNQHGLFTFEQLAKTEPAILNAWMDAADLKIRDAKTWPQQAKLADVAQKYGHPDDRRSYLAYKDWLKDGLEPDEYETEEKDRRATALVWHGSAEATQRAYPEIFGNA